MAWGYDCEVEYLDPNDLLEKSFHVHLVSASRLPPQLALNALTSKAWSYILRYKVSPKQADLTQQSVDLTLGPCIEVMEP
jgi:hypothetical protein